MNKTPKSKAESCGSHGGQSKLGWADDEHIRNTFNQDMSEPTDIIARMEANQARFSQLAVSSINRNQTVHQFLQNVNQSDKPAAFDAWISAIKEIQRKASLPNVELFDDPTHNGQYYGN